MLLVLGKIHGEVGFLGKYLQNSLNINFVLELYYHIS